MKTFPYNKESIEGRRLFRLFDLQYNPGVLDVSKKDKAFETYDVPSVSQCRANKLSFLFPSNLAGLKRPQVRVESEVEKSWGNFAEGITAFDFTHGEELPLVYTQPLEDETLKILIDAGLYRDPQFEELMSKLASEELFEAEADMRVSHLDVGDPDQSVPVLIVEPVDVVHNDHDPSEQTNLADLVKRSARLIIELRKRGVNTEEVVAPTLNEPDREVYIHEPFRDLIEQQDEQEQERAADLESGIVASSELLDQEIDVTDKLKDSIGFTYSSEDDQIRDLKTRTWEDLDDDSLDEPDADELNVVEPDHSDASDLSASYTEEFPDISDIDLDDMDDDQELPERDDEDGFER